MSDVIAYTDGSCDPNPGTAGYGVVLHYGSVRKELSGGEPNSTNNRAEILACIVALKALKRPCVVEIVTDSQYVVNTMTKGWSRNKNSDLWMQLDTLCEQHEVTWRWVRGHTGHAGNERAHVLAVQGARTVSS